MPVTLFYVTPNTHCLRSLAAFGRFYAPLTAFGGCFYAPLAACGSWPYAPLTASGGVLLCSYAPLNGGTVERKKTTMEFAPLKSLQKP